MCMRQLIYCYTSRRRHTRSALVTGVQTCALPIAAFPSERFTGTERYVATDDLKLALNAALALQRPLLIKGEPGTGKTMLAEEVAAALKRPLLQWHIKSTTKAHQGLYEIGRAHV